MSGETFQESVLQELRGIRVALETPRQKKTFSLQKCIKPKPQPSAPGLGTGIRTENYLWKHLPDGAWKGQQCIIVGGGPSLRNFNWDLLEGETVIAINRAFEMCDPTISFAMDHQWWGWTEIGRFGKDIAHRYRTMKGYKVMLNSMMENAWVRYPRDIYTVDPWHGNASVTLSNNDGVGLGGPQGTGPQNNSGFAAVNLALNLGATKIYLLGFDMKGDGQGRQVWWHDGYPSLQSERVYAEFRKAFTDAAPLMLQRADIINLTPDSALECFPFGEMPHVATMDK